MGISKFSEFRKGVLGKTFFRKKRVSPGKLPDKIDFRISSHGYYLFLSKNVIILSGDSMNIYSGDDIRTMLAKTDRPIIIYGTGNGADKIMNGFEILGIKVCGFMASDGFVRDRSFRGFHVMPLSEIESRFPDPVIIIAFGSQRAEVIENILAISKKHTVLCADVPVYGENIFDSRFYEKNIRDIENTYSMLSDDISKHTFENIISFKLSGRLEYLTECFCEKDEAFRNILRLGKNESYLDLGAYRGDTISEFLDYTDGSYSDITALEPDRKTYKKLCEYAGGMENTKLFNMGIWSEDCDMHFNNSLGRGSSIRSDGEQTLAVTKIDTLYKKRRLTYLKADVEGAEEQMIKGGIDTLRRDKPKLNIALYHRSEDIFKLPLMIKKIQPEYNIFMRQHPHIPSWDLNLYAS